MRSTLRFLCGFVAAGTFAACGGGGGGGSSNPTPTALSITTTSLAAGTVGMIYSDTVAATGGTPPYTFSVVTGTLPSPLLLDSGTGVISGTPNMPGSFPFTIQVADSASNTATKGFDIVVNPGGSPSTYAWKQITASGTAPAGRSSFGAAADLAGQMVVTLGSIGNSGPNPVYSDSFLLQLNSGSEAWSSLPTGPTGRWGHSLVLDGNRMRFLLFGGNLNGFTNGNDVWALSVSGTPSWSQLSPTGTAISARLEQGAVFDTPHDRMIVFGGGTGFDPVTAPLNDVWALDFKGGDQGAWTQLSPSGTPPAARAAMVAVFDSTRDRMIVFSGGAAQPTGPTNDIWALDLSNEGGEAWSQIVPSGATPPARQYSAGIYDPVRDTLVIFGGENGASDFGDVWQLKLTQGSETWTAITPSGSPPAARDSRAAVYDELNRRIVVYGGFTRFPSNPFTDIWELDLP